MRHSSGQPNRHHLRNEIYKDACFPDIIPDETRMSWSDYDKRPRSVSALAHAAGGKAESFFWWCRDCNRISGSRFATRKRAKDSLHWHKTADAGMGKSVSWCLIAQERGSYA